MSGVSESSPPSTSTAATGWLAEVRDAERRGELLAAVDLAERGLAEHPDDLRLRHRAVLCLARSGSTEEATRRFESYRLFELEDADEDVGSLGARIAKDRAMAAAADQRPALAARAARRYLTVFEQTRGYYPAINAATLSLIAGDRPAAQRLAAAALESIEHADEEPYYAAATHAEAGLLLGDTTAAARALRRAAASADGDYLALAATRRQLRLICRELRIDEAILAPLAGPAVAHYCGHRITAPGRAGRFQAEHEPRVAAAIGAELDADPIGFAYGSLAAGADILWAEALLARGAELHVVLPFDRDEFIRSSVAPSAADWVERFDACLEAARNVSYATDDAYLDDDVLYRYGAELAMGLALLRARYLDAPVRQLAVWDGGPAHGEAGTSIDVATWKRAGLSTTAVAVGGGTAPSPARPSGVADESHRVVRAILFADVRGFSKLSDEQLPRFTEHVLGALAAAIRPHAAAIEHRNTWGDAVFLVLAGVRDAAACALDLQAAVSSVDLPRHGLPEHLALRLGVHLGPVFPALDPVLGEVGFIGSHISRTARIEPVTPPGVVYVTEPFAAAVALDGGPFSCDYVGHMPAAKDFGRLRMYRLFRKRTTGPDPRVPPEGPTVVGEAR